MKVNFRWETPPEVGMTDGAIYFDDASITEVPGGASLAPVDPLAPRPPKPSEDDPDEQASPNAAPEAAPNDAQR
jgi:hypothetical protein